MAYKDAQYGWQPIIETKTDAIHNCKEFLKLTVSQILKVLKHL